MEKRRFIFLDIDGVLNHDAWYDYLHKTHSPAELRKWGFNKYNISPKSTKLLNQLKGCEVIISSSWFYEDKTVEGLKNAGLKLPIIGGTIHNSLNDKSLCRGNDIAKWFIDNNIDEDPPQDLFLHRGGKHNDNWYHTRCHYDYINGVEYFVIEEGDVAYTYVIIDDYNDMLFQQQEHFVYIDNRIGLTQADIDKAKKILNL